MDVFHLSSNEDPQKRVQDSIPELKVYFVHVKIISFALITLVIGRFPKTQH